MTSGAQFQPSARLRKPAEFKQAFVEGQRVKRQCLATVFRPNLSGDARLGLAIAKKAVPLASDRNRIKRVIREEFRLNRVRLPAVDFVFFAQPGLGKLSNDSLRMLLADIWKKVIERCAPNP